MLLATSDNSVNMCHLFMSNPYDTSLAAPGPCVWSKRLQFAVVLHKTYHHTLPNNSRAYHNTSLVCNFYLSISYDSSLAAAEHPMQWQILWENAMLLATGDISFNVCLLFMPSPYDPSLVGQQHRVWSQSLHASAVLLASNNNSCIYHNTSHVYNVYLSTSNDSSLATAEHQMQWSKVQTKAMLLATSDNSSNMCHFFMPSPHDSSLAAPELRVWPYRLHANEVLLAINNNALDLRHLCLSFFYELSMAAAVSRLRAQGLQFTVLLLEANFNAVPNNLFPSAPALRNFCSASQSRPLVCCAKRGGHPKIVEC